MTVYLKTWDGDLHPIPNKTVEQVMSAISGVEWVVLPSGGRIREKEIKAVLTDSEITFQGQLQSKRKIGQFMKNGHWHDNTGRVEPVALPVKDHLAIGGVKKQLPNNQ